MEELFSRTLAILAETGATSARYKQLEAIHEDSYEDALRVGVAGITSSGKSAFINALMGERLLPEESRATTNLLVRCRRGPLRELRIKIRGEDSFALSGDELTPEAVKAYASERMNPGNHRRVTFFEWRSPDSLLPDDLILVDTPGLDAVGQPDHEQVALRQFLPMADIIIYMTTIRKPLKPADLRLLSSVVENDQRVLFVVSQADLERDDRQGGKVFRTKEEKLEAHVQSLRKEIDQITDLKSYGLVLVSSELARKSVDEQGSAAWQASNFEQVLAALGRFSKDLYALMASARGRRFLANLRESIDDLEPKRKVDLRGRIASVEERGKGLEQTARALERSIHGLDDAWSRELDAHQHGTARAYEKLESLDALRERYRNDLEKWSTLGQDLFAAVDLAQHEFRAMLEDVGIQHRRRAFWQRKFPAVTPPDIEDHISLYTEMVSVRGWFEGMAFWPKKEAQQRERLDREAFFSNLAGYLKRTIEPLRGYLAWWSDYALAVYWEPVHESHAFEKDAHHDLQEAQDTAAKERSRVQTARSELLAIRRVLEELLRRIERGFAADGNGSPQSLPSPAARDHGPDPQGKGLAALALTPMLARFSELAIQREFLGLLGGLGMPDQDSPRVLLLGLPRDENLKFLSLMAHDLAWTVDPSELPAGFWAVCTNDAGFALDYPMSALAPPATLLGALTLVIAPADPDLPAMDWEEFLGGFDAIGVSMDTVRIDSGLADLDRSPYVHALVKHVERTFLLCGHGAFFDDKLENLIVDVVDRVNSYLAPRIASGRVEATWFMHENFDVRYSHFIRLAQRVVQDWGAPEELIRRWRGRGLSFQAPFTEVALRQAMERILVNQREMIENEH